MGGVDDPTETPAPNPTPGGPGADEGDPGPVGQVNELFEVISGGDVKQLEQLLEDGADPNTSGPQGLTALSWAIVGSKSIPTAYVQVGKLLAVGANPNLANNHGATPLHIAALKGDGAIMSALLQAGGDPLIKTARLFAPNEFSSPYEWALQTNNEGVIAAIEAVTDHRPENMMELKARGTFFKKIQKGFDKETTAEKRAAFRAAIEGFKNSGYLSAGDAVILHQKYEEILSNLSEGE